MLLSSDNSWQFDISMPSYQHKSFKAQLNIIITNQLMFPKAIYHQAVSIKKSTSMYHNWPEIRQRSGPAKSCWHLDFNLESEDESYTSDNIASIQREAIYCFSYDITFLLLVLFENIYRLEFSWNIDLSKMFRERTFILFFWFYLQPVSRSKVPARVIMDFVRKVNIWDTREHFCWRWELFSSLNACPNAMKYLL